MRLWSRTGLSLFALSFLSLPLSAQPIAFTYWAPDAATVMQIEARIVDTGGPHKLADYDRYYMGVTAGLKMVQVLFVLPEPGGTPGLHLVEKLPAYNDREVCGRFNSYLDLDKPAATESKGIAACTKSFMTVFLPRKPYWTPDATTIQAMESGMTLPSQLSFRPGPLENYVRYYTGWTRDGHRLIEGKLLNSSYARDMPGVHVVDYGTMWQLGITGGGCGYIMTLYDVDAKAFLRRECYGLG
jgi:hypothetical protein